MTVAAELLRETRLASGLSARGLAKRAGTAPARVSEIERCVHDPSVGTLDSVIRSAGWQLLAIPTRAPTAATVALSILELGTGDGPGEERGFRALLSLSDGLAEASPDVKVALCVAPAPLTGDTRFDAAIAAIVEYHLALGGLPVPSWVHEPVRSLTTPWIPDPYARPDIADDSPEPFRRRGVFLAERELAST